MTLQSDSFATLLELVKQLSEEQQQDLLARLRSRPPNNGLPVDEKMKRLQAVQVDVAVNQEPSPRREDWYDDNGR